MTSGSAPGPAAGSSVGSGLGSSSGPAAGSAAGDAAALRAARTLLFVPGDRPEQFDKAAGAGADLVVLDLEDAVAAGAKDTAREHVLAWLSAGGRAIVRINAVGTDPHEADVAALAAVAGGPGAGASTGTDARGEAGAGEAGAGEVGAGASTGTAAPSEAGTGDASLGLIGLMVPMAASAESLGAIHEATNLPLIALVETAVGVLDARELAAVPGVERLAFGAIDFSLDIDAAEEPETLRYARSHLVLASRASGVAGPIDGVTTDLSGPEPTAADARTARALGMTGKLCVHPKQVVPAAKAFAPTSDEIAWAQGVLKALAEAEAAGSATGALRYEGRMIDEPVLQRARRIVGAV